MKIVESTSELRKLLGRVRREGRSIGLVPTMGNLHAGHISLVKAARKQSDFVVATIFVNPMQFGVNEDLDAYPRTPERDIDMLTAEQTDLLFAPDVREMYPMGTDNHTQVMVPGLSSILCGASRPTHFAGVTTVVSKIFNMVGPDDAYFGQKDFQQLVIIRRMVADLQMPVRVHGCPIVREPDGLAMSSRNGYLSEADRARAPGLQQALRGIAEELSAGNRDFDGLEARGRQAIDVAGMKTDYCAIRETGQLGTPAEDDRDLVILGAAYLGRTRLIDNIQIRVN